MTECMGEPGSICERQITSRLMALRVRRTARRCQRALAPLPLKKVISLKFIRLHSANARLNRKRGVGGPRAQMQAQARAQAWRSSASFVILRVHSLIVLLRLLIYIQVKRAHVFRGVLQHRLMAFPACAGLQEVSDDQ